MSVNAKRWLVQTFDDVRYFDNTDDSLTFRMTDLQDVTWSNEQETYYATGLNGARIGSADRNKYSRLTVNNGAIVDGVMAAQTGSDWETGTIVMDNYLDDLTTTNGTSVTLSHKAVGTTGAEVKFIYSCGTDGVASAKYEQAAAASATKFSYDAATGVVTLPTGVFSANDKVVAEYDVSISNAKKLTNATNRFSSRGQMQAQAWVQDPCSSKSYPARLIMDNAKVSGNFEITTGNDFAAQNVEFESMQSCSSAKLWDFIVFDEDDVEDVVVSEG